MSALQKPSHTNTPRFLSLSLSHTVAISKTQKAKNPEISKNRFFHFFFHFPLKVSQKPSHFLEKPNQNYSFFFFFGCPKNTHTHTNKKNESDSLFEIAEKILGFFLHLWCMAGNAFHNQNGVVFVNHLPLPLPFPQPFALINHRGGGEVLVPYNPPLLTPLGFSVLEAQMDEHRSISLLQVVFSSFFLSGFVSSFSLFCFLDSNFQYFVKKNLVGYAIFGLIYIFFPLVLVHG